MSASRGSFFMSAPISSSVPPSYFLRSGSRTADEHDAGAAARAVPLVLPGAACPRPSRSGCAPRASGSRRRARSRSRPPSRTQGGRQASSPFDAAFHGYWFAATSSPEARAAANAARIFGIAAPVAPVGRLDVPDVRRDLRASRAIRKTSASDASMRFPSERWWVKYTPPTGGRDLRAGDDLVGGVVEVGHVLERRREAERAVLHGLRDERLHPLDLGRSGAPVFHPDDHPPQPPRPTNVPRLIVGGVRRNLMKYVRSDDQSGLRP